MDLDDDKGSGSSDVRSCADCRTTKTPLWRGGPAGPKSLCNACGIRYRKKRRAALGLKDGGRGGGGGHGTKKKREKGLCLKLGILGFRGRDVLSEGQGRTVIRKQRKKMKLREEEEAAVLLMALSSGFLYASSSEF